MWYTPILSFTIPNWGYHLVYKNIEVNPLNRNFDNITGAFAKSRGARIKAEDKKAARIRIPQKKGC